MTEERLLELERWADDVGVVAKVGELAAEIRRLRRIEVRVENGEFGGGPRGAQQDLRRLRGLAPLAVGDRFQPGDRLDGPALFTETAGK
jgi:hypothetical protein